MDSQVKSLFEIAELNSLFTHQELEIQSWVRNFANQELRPSIVNWFMNSSTPTRELMIEFGKLGLFAMNHDDGQVSSANAIAYGLSCLEMDAVDSAFRSCLSVQNSLVIYPILKYGSDSQKTAYLPGLTAGSLIGAFGLTESDHGSDPSNMATNARRSGSDWIISGSKMWITNATIADLFIIWAQTEEGIRGFLLPRDTKGVSTHEIHGKISMRASKTGEVVLDQVRLPDSSLLPGVVGIKGPLSCLTEARYGIIFGVIGSALDSFNTARQYSIVRQQFGRPIAGFQLTQEKLAEMSTEIIKMTLLATHIGRVKQNGRISPELISYGKFSNVKSALSVCRESRTILGAAGITSDYSPIRHSLNLETVLTYEGTHEIHLLTIGKTLTGIQAFQ